MVEYVLIGEEKPCGREKSDTDTAALLYCEDSAKCAGHCLRFPVSAEVRQAFALVLSTC